MISIRPSNCLPGGVLGLLSLTREEHFLFLYDFLFSFDKTGQVNFYYQTLRTCSENL